MSGLVGILYSIEPLSLVGPICRNQETNGDSREPEFPPEISFRSGPVSHPVPYPGVYHAVMNAWKPLNHPVPYRDFPHHIRVLYGDRSVPLQ